MSLTLSPEKVAGVISDYAGVLTNPIEELFAHFETASGIRPEQIGNALRRVAEREGTNPFAELECGRLSEAAFLDRLTDAMPWDRDQSRDLGDFRETWFDGCRRNDRFIAYLRHLHARGYPLALLTNNVVEWEETWRATVPVDELFGLVVNSAHEGTRKPDAEIFRRTLHRLGLPAEACAFVDDSEENCTAARELGLRAVRFQSTDQAIAELEQVLDR